MLVPAKFFPHEVADLTIALDCITKAEDIVVKPSFNWAFRYILLLWLSLVCMIPFDLEQFDEVGKEGEHSASELLCCEEDRCSDGRLSNV